MSGEKYWVIVPAAGVGSRMQADRPKQYLPLCGKTVIEHTLSCFLEMPAIQKVVVPVSTTDPYWPKTSCSQHAKVQAVEGGAERCNSVYNGILALQSAAADNDWVLVHDAARPMISSIQVEKMCGALKDSDVGGLLGVPVKDTMKRVDEYGQVIETVDRNQLWHALTPQMFRYGLLKDALGAALDEGFMVTDEASAIEHSGYKPMMIEGDDRNIKITRPEDLELAEFYLRGNS